MDKSMKRQIGYVRPKAEVTVLKTPAPVPRIPDKATFEAAKEVKSAPSTGSKALEKEIRKKPVKTLKQAPKPPKKAIPPASLNDQAISWIKAHPLFKWNKALEDCGMKAGNASRMVKNGWKVPDDVLPKLVKILQDYGFSPSKK